MKLHITEAQIEDLRVLCEADFGRSVTLHEARQMAHNLAALYEWLYDLHISGRMDAALQPAHGNDIHA